MLATASTPMGVLGRIPVGIRGLLYKPNLFLVLFIVLLSMRKPLVGSVIQVVNPQGNSKKKKKKKTKSSLGKSFYSVFTLLNNEA